MMALARASGFATAVLRPPLAGGQCHKQARGALVTPSFKADE